MSILIPNVFLADGATVPYDSLIVAAGSQTSYFGHNECQEWARGLKSIEEATTIRHKILLLGTGFIRTSASELSCSRSHDFIVQNVRVTSVRAARRKLVKLFKRPKSRFYWYDFTVRGPSLPRVNPGDEVN